MKIHRIVTDSYSGYEAQVKYSLFPFVWFQMNAYKGVNTWNTCEQALEFIRQKEAGTYAAPANNSDYLAPLEMETKHMISGHYLVHKAGTEVWSNAGANLHFGMLRQAY